MSRGWRSRPDVGCASVSGARPGHVPTRAHDLIKQGPAVSSGNGSGEQLGVEALLQAQAMATEDHKEGVATAFVRPLA